MSEITKKLTRKMLLSLSLIYTSVPFGSLFISGVLLSRETMELRPWSVCGGAAAPAVAVETDPRAADPAAVAACEDVVVRGGWVGLCSLAPASSLVFPLLLSFLLCCLDG